MSEKLDHTRSCPQLTPNSDDDCTCGLVERIKTQTAETLLAAWQKRVYESENLALELSASRDYWRDQFFRRPDFVEIKADEMTKAAAEFHRELVRVSQELEAANRNSLVMADCLDSMKDAGFSYGMEVNAAIERARTK